MSIDPLLAIVTGRDFELFLADLESCQKELCEMISGSRILLIGGAGNVGAATVRELITFRPSALHVVDQNENNLVELVRDVRSGLPGLAVQDFRALPLDFGSPAMHRFLLDEPAYDYILNFAAIKHVRSEKDIYSLLHLLDTNVIKTARLLRWLSEKETAHRFFCVSTDKAANPVNLMGASKRIMEHLIFSAEVTPNSKAVVTSARFANVAFSDGSLLDSFLKRLKKHQPLAVPRGVRRYFMSDREAARICLLAAVCSSHRRILIPRVDPAKDLHDLGGVASAILRRHGFEPRLYESELQAKLNVHSDIKDGFYPLLLTPLDTSGEKTYEEFVGAGEMVLEVGMSDIQAVEYLPTGEGVVSSFLRKVENIMLRPDVKVSKEDIVQWMSAVITELRHLETGMTLDGRM